ncbi:hypothetical protein [Marinomonas fungiae]|uniref:Uncharacterized protein n=1 Tax=Marinomonas fungiae TaxID=1137284 RepID=A0A0K6IH02_9GAMM|nr:hypothetical protein [Marinomonas fungiae]CUB02430.1 hypothetical protein Ga0061065_101263 [Marinomonas fungiae]
MKSSKLLTSKQGMMELQKRPFVMSDQMLLEEALTLLDDNLNQLEKLDGELERSIQQLSQIQKQTSERAKLEDWFAQVMQ